MLRVKGMRSEESGLTTNVICDWSDISLLCSKLSALLDRFDEDRFSHLLRYGQSQP